MERTNINIPKAVEMLLYRSYTSEFVEHEEGFVQHPMGHSYPEWIDRKGLISRNGLGDCPDCRIDSELFRMIAEIVQDAIDAGGEDIDHAAGKAASKIMALINARIAQKQTG